MSSAAQKREELAALLNEVRTRVASRYPGASATGHSPAGTINVPLADLMPLVHARDAAQAKMAAIGTVNPRRGGPLNQLIQSVKRMVARSLNWFVRDQITFNRDTVICTEATLQALNEVNFALSSLAGQITSAFEHQGPQLIEEIHLLRSMLHSMQGDRAADSSALAVMREARAADEAAIAALREALAAHSDLIQAVVSENTELKDMRSHWNEWRVSWENKVGQKETFLLRALAKLQMAHQKRGEELEAHVRASIDAQHRDYLSALASTGTSIQEKLWQDLERIRTDYERVIHTELRMVRQKTASQPAAPVTTVASAPEAAPDFDYQKFADKFRGPEEWVRRNQQLYLRYFRDCRNVLDIGCGRGEMLEDLKAANIPAKGIDLSSESVAYCRSKGLDALEADLYSYLTELADGELDGIYCSQVVEHLPPERLPEMIRLCAAKLQRGGVIAIETPNPECLAIFSTHFYLDPTHRKPIPPALLSFYLEEFGLGRIETHSLSPAAELIPQLTELPPAVVERFFGGMDYAVIARKL